MGSLGERKAIGSHPDGVVAVLSPDRPPDSERGRARFDRQVERWVNSPDIRTAVYPQAAWRGENDFIGVKSPDGTKFCFNRTRFGHIDLVVSWLNEAEKTAGQVVFATIAGSVHDLPGDPLSHSETFFAEDIELDYTGERWKRSGGMTTFEDIRRSQRKKVEDAKFDELAALLEAGEFDMVTTTAAEKHLRDTHQAEITPEQPVLPASGARKAIGQ